MTRHMMRCRGRPLPLIRSGLTGLVVQHEPGRLLDRLPVQDVNPRGPEGVFSSLQVDQLGAVLTEIRERAAA